MNDSLIPELPGFDDPLGVLGACHDKMLDHCAMLERLIAHVAEKGVDMEASSAAGKVYRYFNTSARLHHEDEEQDLFPLMAQQSMKIAELVHGLRKDHQRFAELWEQIGPVLKRPQEIEGNDSFKALAAEFVALYRDHIQRENQELIPLAGHSISARKLGEIGEAMKKRREPEPGF